MQPFLEFELIGQQPSKIGWLSLPRFNLLTSVRSFFFFYFWSCRCSLVSLTSSNNFFKVVSAISAADRSFSFKSGNSPILPRKKFSVTFSLVNESRTSSSELGRLCLSSPNFHIHHYHSLYLCTYAWNSVVVHDLLSLLQLLSLYLGIQEQLPHHPLEWVPNFSLNNLKTQAKDSRDMFIDFTSSEGKIFECKIMSTFEYDIRI